MTLGVHNVIITLMTSQVDFDIIIVSLRYKYAPDGPSRFGVFHVYPNQNPDK